MDRDSPERHQPFTWNRSDSSVMIEPNQMLELSIVTPMYNEEAIIAGNLDRLFGFLDSYPHSWELILVNDGSKDRTADAAREQIADRENVRIVDYAINRGRGYALRAGIAVSRGRYVVTQESDLNYGVDIASRLHAELRKEDAHAIIASPYMPGGGVENVPFLRAFLSRYGNRFLRFALPGKLHTVSGMTRGYDGEVIRSLLLTSSGKAIHLEIVSALIELGYRVREVPATLSWQKSKTQPKAPSSKPVRKSKFNLVPQVVAHLRVAFFEKPLLLFGWIGAFLLCLSLGLSVYFTVEYFQGTLSASRPLFWYMILFGMAGMFSLFFGFLAQLILSGIHQNFHLGRHIRQIERRVEDLSRRLDET